LLTGAPIARRDLAALFVAALCWGLGTVISKAALDEIAPVSLLAIQLASSLVILTVLMRSQGIPLRNGGHTPLGRLGILNPGIAYALSLLGLVTISASLSVLLWALEPLLILILAAVVLHERLTAGLIGLSIVAVVGMVIVVYEPSAGTSQLIGVGLTLAGVACCAVYSVITRRFMPGATETGQVVLAQQAYALVVALLLVLVVGLAGGGIVPTDVTPLGLLSAVGSGALYYAGAYWFYLDALRRVPASVAAASFYLIPIVGVAAGALVLGERLEPSQWVGALLVLGAVLAIVTRVARPVSAQASARPAG
jgi:drug/metabolite transporter (DMT)-like permease